MEGRFWHSDPAWMRTSKSYITGRQILTNEAPDRFLVSPAWTKEAVIEAVCETRDLWLKISANALRPSPSRLLPLIEAFDDISDAADFGRAFDAVFAVRSSWGREVRAVATDAGWKRGDRTRILELMVGLWRHRVIAWPCMDDPFPKCQLTDLSLLGSAASVVSTLLRSDIYSENDIHSAHRRLVNLLLKQIGVEEVGDLTPEVVGSAFKRNLGFFALKAAKGLVKTMGVRYGVGQLKHVAEDYGPFGKGALRSLEGEEFHWVSELCPALEEWRLLALAWVASARKNKGRRVTGLNGFFDYLIANPCIPRQPAAYLAKGIPPSPPFKHSNASDHNRVVDFLDWVLNTHFSDEDDEGLPVRLPGFRNPLQYKSKTAENQARGETRREAMPLMFVRMLLEILGEDDWAWAKEAPRDEKHEGDWFKWYNAQTQQYEDTWSPVRTIALWVKLRMPFRTIQVRLLDSGEGDTMIYDPTIHAMISNTGRLASGSLRKPVANGVLQMVHDSRLGREVPILHINTNKTADIDKDVWNRGYECPYAPSDVMEKLVWLRNWQERYNPIAAPVDWGEVRQLKGTKTTLRFQGEGQTARHAGSLSVAHHSCMVWWLTLTPKAGQPSRKPVEDGSWRSNLRCSNPSAAVRRHRNGYFFSIRNGRELGPISRIRPIDSIRLSRR